MLRLELGLLGVLVVFSILETRKLRKIMTDKTDELLGAVRELTARIDSNTDDTAAKIRAAVADALAEDENADAATQAAADAAIDDAIAEIKADTAKLGGGAAATQPDPAIDPAPMDTTNSGVDTLAGDNGSDSVSTGDDTVEG